MKNPIFIVGLPKSGSTLWHNIIAQDTSLFRIAEMHFLNPWRKDFSYFCKKYVGGLYLDTNIKKMIEFFYSPDIIPGLTGWFWIAELKKINDLKFKNRLYSRIIESDRSFGSIFKIVIDEITIFQGYKRCCVKFPVYPNHIPQLMELYPEGKIVHIIRDPRAKAISRTNDPGGTQEEIKKHPYLRFIIKKVMVFFVVYQYWWTSKIHNRYKDKRNYALFHYEDLLLCSEKVIKQLCEFIDVDFCIEMLEPKKGQKSSITGKKTKGFDSKAGTRWEKVISPFDKWIITILTKASMRRFGYDPDSHPIYTRK